MYSMSDPDYSMVHKVLIEKQPHGDRFLILAFGKIVAPPLYNVIHEGIENALSASYNFLMNKPMDQGVSILQAIVDIVQEGFTFKIEKDENGEVMIGFQSDLLTKSSRVSEGEIDQKVIELVEGIDKELPGSPQLEVIEGTEDEESKG
jgi:hypothetical protein